LIGVIIIACILGYIISHYKFPKKYLLIWVSFFTLLFSLSFYFIKLPEERLHIVQYGLMPAIAYFALTTFIVRKNLLLFTAFGIGLFCGLLDEGIQLITPNRYGEWGDVAVNWYATLLGTAFLYSLLRKAKLR